jgi:DNA-binding transcriptional ArsR family regulator
MERFLKPGDGRLPGRLAAMLEPEFHDALGHPTRREILRLLNRGPRSRRVAEIKAELSVFRLGELSYHLQVLRRSGAVTSTSAAEMTRPDGNRYVSEVDGDGRVKAVLRATEQEDRERREAVAEEKASPLLTMFRLPRPVRTIRLRGRDRFDPL